MVDVLVTSVERGKLARVVERFHVGRDRVEVSVTICRTIFFLNGEDKKN